MPPKTSSARRPAASRKKSLAPSADEGGAVEIVVRRGKLRRFDALKTRTAELPVVVTWDRRVTERRENAVGGKGKRRPGERRRTPPFTWDLADFVVVEPPKRQKSSAAPKSSAAARKRKKTPKKS